jgi:hypothetical protein
MHESSTAVNIGQESSVGQLPSKKVSSLLGGHCQDISGHFQGVNVLEMSITVRQMFQEIKAMKAGELKEDPQSQENSFWI